MPEHFNKLVKTCARRHAEGFYKPLACEHHMLILYKMRNVVNFIYILQFCSTTSDASFFYKQHLISIFYFIFVDYFKDAYFNFYHDPEELYILF